MIAWSVRGAARVLGAPILLLGSDDARCSIGLFDYPEGRRRMVRVEFSHLADENARRAAHAFGAAAIAAIESPASDHITDVRHRRDAASVIVDVTGRDALAFVLRQFGEIVAEAWRQLEPS